MTRWQITLALLVAGGIASVLLATDPLSRSLLTNSLLLAVGACAIALPLGMLLAVLVAKTNVVGRPLAVALIGMLLVLPLLAHLSGWDALFGKLGWLSFETGNIAAPFLSGMRGAVWVHGMAAVPWVTLIVSLGLLLVDPRLEEAALLDASPVSVLLRVTLVRAWPFLVGAGVWTILSTTTEMTVTNIYLVNTYTEQIYNAFALDPDLLQVGWRLWPGLVLLATLGLAAMVVLSQLAEAWATLSLRSPLVFQLGKARPLLSGVLWLLLGVLVALPITSLKMKAGLVTRRTTAGTFEHGWSAERLLEVLAQAPVRFRYEYLASLTSAAIAATLAGLTAVVLVWLARRGGWRMMPLALALTLGLAIPGPLVGVAIIWFFNREAVPGFVYLYDRTVIPFAIAQMIRALPVAVLIVWPALASVSRETLEAAELDGLGRWRQLWYIVLPQRRRALAMAWLLAGATALGDLSHSLLVIPPGMDTIQRRIFGLVHAGVDEQVAAATLVLVAGYAGVAAVALALGWRELGAVRRSGGV